MLADVDGNREIELKLEGSADSLKRLRRHPWIRSLSEGRASTQQLGSVYFDTPEHDLAAAGFGLRVRRVGRRRVQTLKGERSAIGGLFERLELDAELDSDEPDLGQISDPEVCARVNEIVEGKLLAPVFRTDFRRMRRALRKGACEWELDIDEGAIAAGADHLPIHEVELELRAGEPASLFEFALLLQEKFDLRPMTRSKAERGYALARGVGAQAYDSRRVRLESDATLEDSLFAILSQCLAHFTANADCAAEGVDPEGVHQMRIGVRRTRAALSVFRRLLPRERVRHFRSELRWLGRELGKARDLDVFTREILGEVAAYRIGDRAFARLREEAEAMRVGCYEAVGECVRSPRYARLVLELGGWIAGRDWREQPLDETSARLFAPGRDFADALFERRYRKVVRLADELEASDEARHAVRIELKKFRYAGEFFRDLYRGRGAKRFLRRAARVQNSLGKMNDIATIQRTLAALLDRLGPERAAIHERAAGFVEGVSAQLAATALRQTGDAWERFERARPFWS